MSSFDWIECEWTKLTGDIAGAEGPIYGPDGTIYCVSPGAGKVLKLDGKQVVTHAETGGAPAGLQVAADGTIWVADMKLGLLRITPTGDVETVQPMRGCNDLALDDDGNLWFTAPAGSSLERPDGEVHCRRANGEIVQIANCFAFPNGVAVSPDGRTLVIAETFTYDLWAWDIIGPGDVTNLRRFGLVPGDQATGGDGMDYDSDGRLIVADWGGNTLDAFDPDGRCVLRMRLPFDAPSNLHFGGDDGRDLLVTEHGTNGLWRGRWPVPGIRLHVACTARSS